MRIGFSGDNSKDESAAVLSHIRHHHGYGPMLPATQTIRPRIAHVLCRNMLYLQSFWRVMFSASRN